MTYPAAPEPLFSGIRHTSGSYRLKFELTSILIRSNTIALMQPSPVGESAKHVVRLTLVPSGETAPAVPGCTEIWATAQAAGTGVANGDKVAYPTGSPKHRSCSEPAEGLYELRYELDPFDKWDEDSHEDNNQGTARGYWYYPG
jgi:hypothetical protein